MPETPPTAAELALEHTGLEFLRAGKFRRARDAFKSLKKTQPARALPLLIEANLGLAKEMMSKGLVSEANQVLAYLKTIAPASYNLDLTASSREKTSDAWSALVPLAAQRLASSTSPEAAIRAADEMILGADSPDHPAHPDAKAILTALELGYGSAVVEQTAPLLRSVPRSSPFSHWVFFFKGMTALEAGAHARAADNFRRIPESSLLQASVPALLKICGEPATPKPAPRTVRALCAWAGHPELAGPLIEAEPLWRKKRRSKALTLLIKKITNLLRWGARDFKADLARLLTGTLVQDNDDDPDYCETLVHYISASKRPDELAVVDAAFFALPFDKYPQCAHSHFQTALANLDSITTAVPVSPAMLSRIHTRLAASYIASVKKDPHDLCSPPNARRALELAIKHDPDHLHAWLTQCDLLAMGQDSSAYHRFLDALTKRFPTEKEVLIRNGDCCISRGSFTKALRNFENAAEIDSVDPRIARGILRARLGIAEQAYKKHNFTKVDWDLIESLASPDNSCPEFSLWRLRVHKLVMETLHGRGREGNLASLAANALPLAPNVFRFELASRMTMARYKMEFRPHVLKRVVPSRQAPQSLADFLAVIDEVDISEDGAPYDFAAGTAREIFAEHKESLLKFCTERKDLTTLLLKIFSSRVPDLGLASPIIQHWFQKTPSDPILRYLCHYYQFRWLPQRRATDMEELVDEIHESADQVNKRLLMLFEKNRQRVTAEKYGERRYGRSAKLDLDYDPHAEGEVYGDGAGDDDDDDDYEDQEEAVAALLRATANMSPGDASAAMAKFIVDGSLAGLGDVGEPAPRKAAKTQAKKPPKKPPAPPAAPDSDQLTFDSLFTPPSKS